MKNFSDRYSLSLHQAVAERLRTEPAAVLRIARDNLKRWLSSGAFDRAERSALFEWQEILIEGRPETIISIITADSDEGQRLRSSSPFAGVLSSRERDMSWSACAEIGLA